MIKNKKYKAIFFDWDGTAVESRRAPVDDVLPPMIKLLEQGVKLAIISGTTYENIAYGKLHELIPVNALQNLYLGLGRGVYNNGYDKDGNLIYLQDNTPDVKTQIAIHEIAFEMHKILLEKYNYASDIVFTRPNYCKIDIMVNNQRGEQLFLQANEIDKVNADLKQHGYDGGLRGLCDLAAELGAKRGMKISATTDAKYIEVGPTTKSDNVNFLLTDVMNKAGIALEDCCFWGDEYTYLGEGITGSDYQMYTELTRGGDFYDCSPAPMKLPEGIIGVGGGIKSFENFLRAQGEIAL